LDPDNWEIATKVLKILLHHLITLGAAFGRMQVNKITWRRWIPNQTLKLTNEKKVFQASNYNAETNSEGVLARFSATSD